jgi:hypothetical protein
MNRRDALRARGLERVVSQLSFDPDDPLRDGFRL